MVPSLSRNLKNMRELKNKSKEEKKSRNPQNRGSNQMSRSSNQCSRDQEKSRQKNAVNKSRKEKLSKNLIVRDNLASKWKGLEKKIRDKLDLKGLQRNNLTQKQKNHIQRRQLIRKPMFCLLNLCLQEIRSRLSKGKSLSKKDPLKIESKCSSQKLRESSSLPKLMKKISRDGDLLLVILDKNLSKEANVLPNKLRT